ncbi:mas-related G-protein coupled receptor member A1-like [Rhopilema esculentum]|uniref:mas-related G-protein coupled receptor member A1-like n=1 Tax=Rhopilema esculentum TaxID=499914 RepID=UPI0031DD329C|eukprot:gene13708-4625_t
MNGTAGNATTGLDQEAITSLALGYTVSTLVIILNGLEIYIIRKRWKKITDFELILFNLATADCLTGIAYLISTGLETHWYLTDKSLLEEIYAGSYILIFIAVIMSVNFVILIGIERLFAVRLPLQHRMFHMKRRRVYGGIAIIWLLTIVICALAVVLDHVINNGILTEYGSKYLGIAYGAFLSLQSLVIIIIYSSLAFYVVKRQSKFKKFNRATFQASRKSLETSWKKERTTLIVCFLVVASFIICTTPFSVKLYKRETEDNEDIVLLTNSAINPLIYFFKGFVEKYHRRKKFVDDAFKVNKEMGRTKRMHVVEAANNPAFEEKEDD